MTAQQRRQTLEQWIDECMTDEDKDGKISAFALVHLKGQSEQEIHAIKFGARKWTAKELALVFRHKAEGYAEELPGVQTFNLQAFYGRDEPQAWKPFTVSGAHEYTGGATEAPTSQGLTQQLMRHNEVQFQTYSRGMAAMASASADLVRQVSEQNTSLQSQVSDLFSGLQRMLLDKMSNDHTGRMKELEYQRSTQERAKWFKLLPAIASNILGTDIIPQSTADSELLDAMAEAIDADGLKKLASSNIFPQELAGLLYARWHKGLQKKREEQAERETIARRIDPEQELAGNLPG